MTNLFGYSYSVPIDCLKIPALNSSSKHLTYQRSRNYIFFSIFTALNHGTIFTGYKRYVVRYYEINQRLITKDYSTYRHFILMKARPMQCMHSTVHVGMYDLQYVRCTSVHYCTAIPVKRIGNYCKLNKKHFCFP